MPPNYSVARENGCVGHVENLVIEAKRRYHDPYIIVAGDFNQWTVQDGLQEFVDMSEVIVGRTRGDRLIDRIFFNLSRAVRQARTGN